MADQPYYTAVPQVQTLGPSDPNAPAAAKLYTVVSGILGLVGIASTFGLLTTEQSASLGAVGTAATTLVGAVVTAIASFRTNKQLRNGTFTPAPVQEAPHPAITAVEGIKAVADQYNDLVGAVTAGVQRVQDVAGGLAAAVPGLGALLPGSLAAQVAQQAAQQAAQPLFGAVPPTPASAIPTQ